MQLSYPLKTSLVNGQGLGSLPIADNAGFQVAFTRFIKVLVCLFGHSYLVLVKPFLNRLPPTILGLGIVGGGGWNLF